MYFSGGGIIFGISCFCCDGLFFEVVVFWGWYFCIILMILWWYFFNSLKNFLVVWQVFNYNNYI